MRKRVAVCAVWIVLGCLLLGVYGPQSAVSVAFNGAAAGLSGVYRIPGLDETRLRGTDGRVEVCRRMTFQGVCTDGKRVFISAYCSEREHASVLYALDRKTGAHIGTMSLGMRVHAGGIAYDRAHGKLYVTCDDGTAARVASLPVKAGSFRGVAEDVRPQGMRLYDLPELERASFLTCRDDVLYVGAFSLTGAGVLQAYEIHGGGELEVTAGPLYETAIPDKVQGVTFYGDKVLFSRSYGVKGPSEVLVFKECANASAYAEEDAAARLPMPAMLEQITAEGERLYLVFESAAWKYSRRTDCAIDCVCVAELERLLA